jgi:hypothetical protein
MNVKVTFKYGGKGQTKATVTTTQVLPLAGKTESLVMEALRKRNPSYDVIVIVKIE